MAKVRFTRRCFEEDLQRLPGWAQKEAIILAREIEKTPEVGRPLAQPLERFRHLWIRDDYRLIYTYDFESDTQWIYLVGERKPGRPGDVYAVLRELVKTGKPLK